MLDKFKRKGYGTYLMNFTENFARQKNKKFVCFSVLLENIPAITLYNKLKYKSLGIGLTLLRLFMWKFSKELEVQNISAMQISFQPLLKMREKYEKNFHWWYEEIKYFAGEMGYFLAKNDDLIDFDFNKQWLAYEIFTNNIAVGNLVIIPSNFFQTILLFSDPEITWNKDWFYNFIKAISEQHLIPKKLSSISNTIIKETKLGKTSVLQIFLTHQHKDNILNLIKDDFGFHDKTEDRQILYKNLSYN